MTNNLGRLERVDLRDIWQSEPQDFTPWLAEEANLALLAEALNMELALEAREKEVGSFSADILCINIVDNSLVLIENQLERTDHTHLGQLMTYAAGLHTVDIVWIAAKFTEEHRAAMDWLNEITDVQFRFFGLEVEVWRIGGSLAAPKFNIVSQPNDWSRSVARSVREAPATGVKAEHQRYWQALRDQFEESGTWIRPQRASPKHWMNIGVGKAGMKLVAIRRTTSKSITVGFETFHEDAKKVFDLLHAEREAIEAELGFEMEWCRRSDRKAAVIWYTVDADISNEADWPNQISWMQNGLERLDAVFRPRVQALDLDAWIPPDDEDEEAT